MNNLCSIVIASAKEDDWVRVAIENFLNEGCACFPLEIIVVDNGSPVKMAPVDLSFWEGKRQVKCTIYHFAEAMGTSKAKQYGLERATGDVRIVTDAHILVNELGIKNIYGIAKEYIKLGRPTILCPSSKDMTGAHNGHGADLRMVKMKEKNWPECKWGEHKEGEECALMGGFYVFPAEILKQVYFNPVAIGWGGDEEFITMRANALHIPIKYTEKISVGHKYHRVFKINPKWDAYAPHWNCYSATIIHFPSKREQILEPLANIVKYRFMSWEEEFKDKITSEIELVKANRKVDEETLWNKIMERGGIELSGRELERIKNATNNDFPQVKILKKEEQTE